MGSYETGKIDRTVPAISASVVPEAIVVTFADGKVAVMRAAEVYGFALSPDSLRITGNLADLD